MAIIEILVGGMGKAELIAQIRSAGIKTNKYAEILFNSPKLKTSSSVTAIKIVEVSVKNIGLPDGGTMENIVSKASNHGLALCSLELALRLRLNYLNQAEGPYLTVASEKLETDNEFPSGLYLRKLGDGLWLRGYRASDDYIWAPDSLFVFSSP